MKKPVLYFLFLILFSIQSFAQISHEQSSQIADRFLDNLIKNDSKAMYAQFNATVKGQLTPEQTSQIWAQITSLYGKYESRTEIQTSDYEGFVICKSNLNFQKGKLEAKITIDKDSLVSGFFMVPKTADEDYVLPAYADTTKFVEMKLKFGKEPFILDGILSLPKSNELTPVVILVHGSGPHDMDETIGPNKPFKDIAWGLASQGISILRYNKRTKQYPAEMAKQIDSLDIYDEVVDDVTYAVNFLRHNAKLYNIDKNKIYVLGHSLGGTMLPRIALKNDSIAGLISLAGMTRRIENVLLEQYNYLFTLDDTLSADEKKQIEGLQNQIRTMLSPKLNMSVPSDSLPLSMPAKYWMTFRNVNPAFEIQQIDKRIFILQGGRDYQVTVEDFNIWKDALKTNKKSKLSFYDDLNHLFQKGKGKSVPDEYYLPIKVDSRVIADISAWIKE